MEFATGSTWHLKIGLQNSERLVVGRNKVREIGFTLAPKTTQKTDKMFEMTIDKTMTIYKTFTRPGSEGQ